jgi:NAD-dependent DNA ligase
MEEIDTTQDTQSILTFDKLSDLHDHILKLDQTEILPFISTYKNFDQLVNLKLFLDDLYYNSEKESKFSDLQYDILKDFILLKKPEAVKVGAIIRDGRSKVRLPHYLGGADKITTEVELAKFINSEPCKGAKEFVLSAKLDGVSGLIVSKEDGITIYKRGDEIEGSDISYVSDYLHFRKDDIKFAVRGEFIMSKKNFQKYKKDEKESGHIENKYRSARGAIASITNSDTARPALQDMEFIPYENILKNNKPPAESIKKLSKYGFKPINFRVIPKEQLTYDYLLEYLKELRTTYEFEVDGVIVQPNLPYKHISSGNPDYFVAFKHNFEEDNRVTTITKIEWNLSKDGKLIPTVFFEPIFVDNVKIVKASGFNGSFIFNNSLNVGSKIVVIRSKQVIPHILRIIESSETPSTPDEPFIWDDNKTHYMINMNMMSEDKKNQHCIKIIANFFEKMKCANMAESTIEKIYNHNKNSDLFWFLNAKEEDFIGPGIGKRLAEKLRSNMNECLQNVKLSTLFHATNIFKGMGETLLEDLFPTPEVINKESLPELLQIARKYRKDKKTMKTLARVETLKHSNMGGVRADIIADNIDTAYDFLKNFIKVEGVSFFTPNNENGGVDMSEVIVCFSGVRDSELEKAIESRGGTVKSSAVKSLTHLIVKDSSVSTTKTQKAEANGTVIISIEDFKEEFGL